MSKSSKHLKITCLQVWVENLRRMDFGTADFGYSSSCNSRDRKTAEDSLLLVFLHFPFDFQMEPGSSEAAAERKLKGKRTPYNLNKKFLKLGFVLVGQVWA